MVKGIKARSNNTDRERSSALRLCFLLIFILLFCPDFAHARFVEMTVANVNGDIILLSDIKRMSYYLEKVSPSSARMSKREILDILIREKVIQRYAASKNLDVKDKELDTHMEQTFTSKGFSMEEFVGALVKQGVDEEIIRSQFRTDLLTKRLAFLEVEKPNVSDDLLKEHYLANRNRFKTQLKLNISNILIPFNPKDRSSEADAKSTIEKILAKLRSGEKFEKLATEFSEDRSAAYAGKMGWVDPDRMLPEISKGIRNLKKGGYSNIVKTSTAFHLFRLNDIEPARQLSYDEAKDMVSVDLQNRSYEQNKKKWYDNLVQESHVEILFDEKKLDDL